MLLSFEQVSDLITAGRVLHISGSETLLKNLPKGNWIGGTTEYFMAKDGGKVTDEFLYVSDFPYPNFSIETYDEETIKNIAKDAYDDGFSVAVVPFDSAVHKEYAKHASDYPDIFMKNIIGWISGINLNKPDQTPLARNGLTGEVFTEKAVVMHLSTPGKSINVNIINIFEQDENSPLIEFENDGFVVDTCLIDGVLTKFADYISTLNIDTKLPLVGDYSGSGINISFRSIENGIVNLYAPVFPGIEYRLAKSIDDYAGHFNDAIADIDNKAAVFSCNCILNFLYGELEGKKIEALGGPITFGEIAYQLVNQTLVYVTVS